MTILSITAISHLAERFVRQHRRLDLGTVVVLLSALDVPAPRAHAGIQKAVEHGRISLLNSDSRPVLAVADTEPPREDLERNAATEGATTAAVDLADGGPAPTPTTQETRQ